MAHLLPQDLLSRLEWRYATKSFEAGRQIDHARWEALEAALRLTPSSYGLQPWKFLVVQDQALKEQLRLASFNQKQVTECSHFVVFTALRDLNQADVDKFLDALSATRAIERSKLDGYRKVIVNDIEGTRKPYLGEWLRHQCYIALGNFMTSAALLGVDTCPMEGLVPARYDEILGLTNTRYQTVVACAAGFRSPADATATAGKVRYPLADVLERR